MNLQAEEAWLSVIGSDFYPCTSKRIELSRCSDLHTIGDHRYRLVDRNHFFNSLGSKVQAVAKSERIGLCF